MDWGFLLKASGIVFRESFEAILIYGIIVSFFQKNCAFNLNIKEARLGFFVGVLASLLMGIAMAQTTLIIPEKFFSVIELITIFGGSFFMLYMVFWISKQSKTLKKELEGELATAIKSKKNYSVFAVVFFSVFREGVETVVYLYSIALENKSIAHISIVVMSLLIGIILSYIIYFVAIKGTKSVSLQTIFRITGIWLLLSASSLLSTGIDKLFSGDWLTSFQGSIFSINTSESMEKIMHFFESISGFRFQPTIWHSLAFLTFWGIVIIYDPLLLKKGPLTEQVK